MAAKFRAPVNSMDDGQKEWFATAMIAMVLADGDVSQDEVESLMATFSFIKDPERLERLKKYLQYKTMPHMTAFVGWQKNPKGRALLLIDLMETAIADRDFSPTEREQFLRIGQMLGFPAAQVEQFIAMGDKALGGGG